MIALPCVGVTLKAPPVFSTRKPTRADSDSPQPGSLAAFIPHATYWVWFVIGELIGYIYGGTWPGRAHFRLVAGVISEYGMNESPSQELSSAWRWY